MKRLGSIWPQVVAFDNLLLAWRRARAGKRSRSDVAAFEMDLEHELLELQRQLSDGSYRPGEYRLFTIYERKPRMIAAAPIRDRVVHHALMNVIEPPLDRTFIHDSYACRKGRGVHTAVARYQQWSRRYTYALKLDISRYFPSIDHDRLKAKLRRRIKDKDVIRLLDLIIDGGPVARTLPGYFPDDDLLSPLTRRVGIPIGNLTSQFFANLYLDDLDHKIKEEWRAPAYLRYVDDMLLLSDSKQQLWETRARIEAFLTEERLVLHPKKVHLCRTRDGLDLLGYRVFPDFRLLRNDNGHRFARKLRGYARGYEAGCLGWEMFNPSVQSWIGHAGQADTKGLRQRIFAAVPFRRGVEVGNRA